MAKIKEILKAYQHRFEIIDEALRMPPHLTAILKDESLTPEQRTRRYAEEAHKTLSGTWEVGRGSSRHVMAIPGTFEMPVRWHSGAEPIRMRHPAVLKMAYEGYLDKYRHKLPKKYQDHTGRVPLLGEEQNAIESEPFRNNYSIFPKNVNQHGVYDGTYRFNPHGVTSPVLGNHPEHHFMYQLKMEPFDEDLFKRTTQTKEFPKGLEWDQVYDSMRHHWDVAHGKATWKPNSPHVKLLSHPFVSSLHDFTMDTATHPSDNVRDNVGHLILGGAGAGVPENLRGKVMTGLLDSGFGYGMPEKYNALRKIADKMGHPYSHTGN